jgi:hypothetical protein
VHLPTRPQFVRYITTTIVAQPDWMKAMMTLVTPLQFDNTVAHCGGRQLPNIAVHREYSQFHISGVSSLENCSDLKSGLLWAL